MTRQPWEPSYVVGLDLGQSQDYTALSALERTWRADPRDPTRQRGLFHYAVRHLRRWHLGTSYVQVVEDVAAMLSRPPLEGADLAVDQTGVGAAVVDVFRRAQLPARLSPVLITAGHRASRQPGGVFHVPKKELVSVLQVLLQTRRLKIAPLPERDVLARELGAFRVKVTTAGNETFEAWRERDHDDLVLAVALAAWLGERPRARIGASC